MLSREQKDFLLSKNLTRMIYLSLVDIFRHVAQQDFSSSKKSPELPFFLANNLHYQYQPMVCTSLFFYHNIVGALECEVQYISPFLLQLMIESHLNTQCPMICLSYSYLQIHLYLLALLWFVLSRMICLKVWYWIWCSRQNSFPISKVLLN